MFKSIGRFIVGFGLGSIFFHGFSRTYIEDLIRENDKNVKEVLYKNNKS